MRIGERIVLLFWLLLLTPSGLAQVGEPPENLLGALAGYQPVAEESGGYRLDNTFLVTFEVRGGLVYRVQAEGPLEESGAPFMGELVGMVTGYGQGIAEPATAFFTTRAPALAGQGAVTVGVEAYALDLEVTSGEPLGITFGLSLQEVPEEAFPPAPHALGPEDAPYVIREFSDFQCPFCRNFARDALPQIKELLLARGDVRFEYHHFPLVTIHANAAPAAEAAECVAAAHGPEAFWTYHDALFERQQAWQGLGESAGYFVRLAQDLDLGGDEVQACVDGRVYADRVDEAYRIAGGVLRLGGTPTVFVNGFRVANFLETQSYLDLFVLIDAFSEE